MGMMGIGFTLYERSLFLFISQRGIVHWTQKEEIFDCAYACLHVHSNRLFRLIFFRPFYCFIQFQIFLSLNRFFFFLVYFQQFIMFFFILIPHLFPQSFFFSSIHTHTHTHTHIYIYVHNDLCIWCLYSFSCWCYHFCLCLCGFFLFVFLFSFFFFYFFFFLHCA